jgi:hypothetical protein
VYVSTIDGLAQSVVVVNNEKEMFGFVALKGIKCFMSGWWHDLIAQPARHAN